MSIRKFPDIGQFRNTIKSVRDFCKHHDKPLPVLHFVGTVKLHGTNAGICVRPDNRVMYQSRTRWITPDNDNHGFATWADSRGEEDYIRIANDIREEFKVDANEPVIFYGEWCGNGINDGAGICTLDYKMFILFAIRVGEDEWVPRSWFTERMLFAYSVYGFGTFGMDIDFSKPEYSQNELIGMTQRVEEECPVTHALMDKKGVGEGIVWTTEFPIPGRNGLVRCERFKVKGDKHSVTKVKKLAEVDIEKVRHVLEFADKVTTENRLLQGVDYLRQEQLDDKDIRNIGPFLKWIVADVMKEESDTMIGNGLDKKDVCRAISQTAKNWYTDRL
jgi:hypothetical protein